MRSNDKYVNFIKVYAVASYTEKRDIERTVIKEGDLLSFAILNYAITLTESLEKAKKTKLQEEDINNEYIGLLLTGFKFFKISKVEEFLKIAEDLMKESQAACHSIYYHLQEYFIARKKITEDKISYRKYNKPLSDIELVVACSLSEHTSVDFDGIDLNLKGNDIAIIRSRGVSAQEEVIRHYVENLVGIRKYLREGFISLLYLVSYIDLKNLPILVELMDEGLAKEDLLIKNMVNAVVENPLLNKEKKEFLMKNFYVEKPKEEGVIFLGADGFNLNGLSQEMQDFLSTVDDKSSLGNLLQFSKDYESGAISKEKFQEEVRHALIPQAETAGELTLLYSWVQAEEINKLRLKDKEDIDLVSSIAENMYKPKISLTDAKLEQVEELKKELPNFSEVIDFIISQVKLNIFHNNKMSFKPILLLGNPGLGKTYVAKELARILSTGFEFIDFASTSAAFVIKGGSKQWKDADAGKILKLMNSSNTINPVVLYDEIDKNNMNKNYPPEVVLYQLFEPMNAKNFEDEYLGLKFDASSIINICTANSLDTLTTPLQSRMKIFDIQKLSPAQNRYLIEKMYQKTISNYSIFDSVLSSDIISSMENFTPREIDGAIQEIITKNIQKLSVAELMAHRQNRLNLQHVELSGKKVGKHIGF